MRVIKPFVKVVFHIPENCSTIEENIESIARVCYKSENRICSGSATKLIRSLRRRGHHAMLEFGYATATIVADRGLSHELVRHRLASFAQESTRYCNYSLGKFNSEITVIEQPGLGKPGNKGRGIWLEAMASAERYYFALLEKGVKAEIARSVLPIGLKTEITIGANLREWRHIFELRCSKKAHPIIRSVMLDVLRQFNRKLPSIYEDLADNYLKLGEQ